MFIIYNKFFFVIQFPRIPLHSLLVQKKIYIKKIKIKGKIHICNSNNFYFLFIACNMKFIINNKCYRVKITFDEDYGKHRNEKLFCNERNWFILLMSK